MQWLLTLVSLYIIRCLSRGHISESKQDRSIVSVEHCHEYGIADSVAIVRFCPDAPGGGVTAPFVNCYWLIQRGGCQNSQADAYSCS